MLSTLTDSGPRNKVKINYNLVVFVFTDKTFKSFRLLIVNVDEIK